jgi:hypothetical protein
LNKKALDSIRITQDQMAHNTEIVRQIKKNNLKFIEIPVDSAYVDEKDKCNLCIVCNENWRTDNVGNN